MSVFYSKTFSERTICISISACFQAEYESSMSRQWPYPKVPSAVFILTKITKDWRISKQKTLFFRLPIPNRILPYQKDVIVRAIRSGCPLPCFNTPVLQFYSSLSIWLSFIIVLLLPCDLSWTYFPAKVIGCSNLANAGVPPRVSRKNLPLRLSSVFFRISLVPIVSATFWRQKNKSQRSQTGRTKGKKRKVKLWVTTNWSHW